MKLGVGLGGVGGGGGNFRRFGIWMLGADKRGNGLKVGLSWTILQDSGFPLTVDLQ